MASERGYAMTRTQIQLPDDLYRRAKALAAAKEISLAELVRNGLEYMLNVSAPPESATKKWELPKPFDLGPSLVDPFADPDWRCNLHMERVLGPMLAERNRVAEG